jgi:hypothetical protein
MGYVDTRIWPLNDGSVSDSAGGRWGVPRWGRGFDAVSQRARDERDSHGAPPTGPAAAEQVVRHAAAGRLGGCDACPHSGDQRYAAAAASQRTRVADHARREDDLARHLLGGAKRDALQVRAVLQLQDGALALRDGRGAAGGRITRQLGQWRDEARARRGGGRAACVCAARWHWYNPGGRVPYPKPPQPRARARTSDSSKPLADEAARAEARLDSGDVALTAAGARAAARRMAEVAKLLANIILTGRARGWLAR